MKTYIFSASVCILICFANLSPAQVNVDKFTGDLSYTIHIATLPHPSGNDLPIQVTYSSDIKVEQDAGPVGLGWRLNLPGFVSRSVSGVPDDWNDVFTLLEGDTVITSHTGVLHPESNDIYRSTFRFDTLVERDGHEFLVPDYDQYQVVGYGMDGIIKPRLLEYTTITHEDPDLLEMNNSKKPGFTYEGDFFDTLNFRYADWSYGTFENYISGGGSDLYLPTTAIGSPSSTQDYEGSGYNDQNHFQSKNQNRLRTQKYIEYFTNEEIYDHNYGNGTTLIINGFMEYATGVTRNPANGFEDDEIGAFRITDESGFTYHYSLPVYVNSTTKGTYDLKYDYTPYDYSNQVDTIKDSTYLDPSSTYHGEYIIQNDSNRRTWEVHSEKSYASEWSLTGITGPDFDDYNDNGIIDENDRGYWVKFHYTKYDFVSRTPYLGHMRMFTGIYLSDEEPNELLHSQHEGKLSQCVAVFSTTEMEVSRMDSIETATHFLIADRFSRDDAREAINDYDYKGTGGSQSSNYLQGISQIRIKEKSRDSVISRVKFIQDYSLARGYHSNKNNSLTSYSDKYSSAIDVQSNVSFNSSCTNCGKLTLKEIETYGTQNMKTQPDYEFDYHISDTAYNPHFNTTRQDYWGNYKNRNDLNGLSGYTSNHQDAKAWSLVSGTSPMGGKIEIEYESDTYEKVLSESYQGGTRGASRMFAIKDANWSPGTIGQSWQFELHSGANDYRHFMNKSYNSSGEYTAIFPLVLADTNCFCSEETEIYQFRHRSHLVDENNFSNLDTTGTYEIDNMYSDPNNQDNLFPIALDDPELVPCYNAPSECDKVDMAYTGNGYIQFKFNEGTEVLGGGTRVASISKINSQSETYVTRYTYSNGMATSEADIYHLPYRHRDSISTMEKTDYFMGLMASRDHKFQIAPMVGYGSVIEENMGAGNSSLGKIEFNFHTTPQNAADSSDTLSKPYYRVNHFFDEEAGYYMGITTEFDECTEYVDKFSSFWGLPTSQKVYDQGDRLIKSVKYEYESPVQGAITEAFVNSRSVSTNYVPPPANGMFWLLLLSRRYSGNKYPPLFGATSYVTWGVEPSDPWLGLVMVRTFPSRLKRIITYDQGITNISEAAKYHRITGEWMMVRSLDENENNSTQVTVKAFERGGNTDFGPKVDNIRNQNILKDHYMETKYADSNLTEGDLEGVVKSHYSNFCKVREYHSTPGKYKSQDEYTPYFKKATYAWRGRLGKYGLYKKSLFKDFQQTRVISGSWLSTYATQNSIGLYNNSGWVDTIGASELSGADYTNNTFLLYDRDEYDENFPESDLQDSILLFDANDFQELVPDHSEQPWALKKDRILMESGSVVSKPAINYVPEGWRKTRLITLVNDKYKILETRDVNERFKALKYCFDGLIPYASGYNTNYVSYTACSFEELIVHSPDTFFEGEVTVQNGVQVESDSAHSGGYHIHLKQSGVAGYTIHDNSELLKGKTYRASVWVRETEGQTLKLRIRTQGLGVGNEITDSIYSDSALNITVGNWVLMNLDLEIPEAISSAKVIAEVVAPSGGDVDDIRFHPLDAKVSSTVFDRITGLKLAELDANNIATHFVYDSRDKLIEVWQDVPQKGKRRVKELSQNFARSY